MLNLLRVLLLGLLIALPGPSQSTMLLTGAGGPGTAAPAYQGPGDVLSSWALYASPSSCFSNAFSGSIADVVDSSTGNTTGTRLQCGAGGIITAVVSGSACTFVTGNACSPLATTCAVACKFTELYDQSGNSRHLIQVTLSAMPVATLSALNGFLGATCTTGVCVMSTTGTFSFTQPYTWVALYNQTGGAASAGGVIADSNSASYLGGTASTNQAAVFAGTAAPVTASAGSYHAITALVSGSGSNCAINVDGSDTAGLTCGTNNIAVANLRFNRGAGNQLPNIAMAVGMINATTTPTNRNTYSTNARAIYGAF